MARAVKSSKIKKQRIKETEKELKRGFKKVVYLEEKLENKLKQMLEMFMRQENNKK